MESIKDVKAYIYENQKIELILEELGCQNIKKEQGGDIVVAQLPPQFNSNNKRSVQVYNDENLRCYVRSRGISGDIFSLIGYVIYEYTTFEEIKSNFTEVKRFVLNCLDIKMSQKKTKKKEQKDWNGWLSDIRKDRKREVIYKENIPYGEEILNTFKMIPNIWWRNEGISLRTQEQFEAGLDAHSQRIIFPIRDEHGRLVGVKGRYVGNNQDILENKKYMYLYKCNKSVMFFNMHRAIEFIKEKREVIVVESEKSVMLLHQFGFKNSVAIAGDSMSSQQIEILLSLGIETRLVFAWDKDKDGKFIQTQLAPLRNRMTFYLFDDQNLFQGKDSPVDLGADVWEQLYYHNMKRFEKGATG